MTGVGRCLGFLCALILVPACGGPTTRLTTVWSDSQFQGRKARKVLVMAITQRENVRDAYERRVCERLAGIGVNAIPSLDVFFHNEELSKEVLQEDLADLGVDAVIVSRLISVDTETYYVPGYVPYPYYNDFYGYYGAVYGPVYSPGYLSQSTIVQIETNLYETATAKLAWSGVSESFDPRDPGEVIDALSQLVVTTLRREGFLVPGD